MIVALLAVLKAGGAYLPLDSSYTSERLRDILMDGSPGILIADDHGKLALRGGFLSSVIVIDPSVMEVDSDSKR
jgi:non-ribosomal peptide synthetase component F